jgi:hypothetical protein
MHPQHSSHADSTVFSAVNKHASDFKITGRPRSRRSRTHRDVIPEMSRSWNRKLVESYMAGAVLIGIVALGGWLIYSGLDADPI